MSAYDDWKTTDDGIESQCEDCGVDTRFDEHEDKCSQSGHEPDFEAMLDRQLGRNGYE